MKQVKRAFGVVVWWPTLDEVMSSDEDDTGFCLACGADRQAAEPDAAKYECEECGKPAVFGAAEFAMRGWIAD